MRTDAPRPAEGDRNVVAAVVAAVLLLTACAGPVASPSVAVDAVPTASAASRPPTAAPTPSASSRPTAADDLDRLLSTLERSHPEPFHGISREEFVDALDAYEASLSDLAGDEAVVEFMRVWAMLSREGRDGHQFAFPLDEHDGPVLPIRIYEFVEGTFVTDALPPHEAIVGGRITAIEGTPIADVLAAIEPLVPRDGPATVSSFRPMFVLRTDVLGGLGIIGDGPVSLEVESADGVETVELDPIPLADHADWAGRFGMHQLPLDERVRYLTGTETFTSSLLDDGTLYLRYRFIGATPSRELADLIDGGEVQRIVLDIRQNPGGNNSTFLGLRDVIEEFAADHPGATTVITDRVTFSAASNLATDLEQRTDARFVGEAMGGGLNFWNDVGWIELPNLPVPMRAAISARHWVFAAPDDPRLTIEPDLPVEVTAADYFAGRDRALEAALAGE